MAGWRRVTGRCLSIVTTRTPSCEHGPSGRRSSAPWPLPAAGQTVRRLTLGGRGEGDDRLPSRRAPRGPLAAAGRGVWQRAGGRTRHLARLAAEPLAGSLSPARALRLAAAPPRLVGWGVDLTVQTVSSAPTRPGRYILAYGGARRRASQRAAAAFAGETLGWKPGPRARSEPPPPAARRHRSGRPPDRAPARRRLAGRRARREAGLAGPPGAAAPRLRRGAGRPRQPPAALGRPPDPFPALVAGGSRAGARGHATSTSGERRPAVGGERGGDPPPRAGPAAVARCELTAPAAPLRRPTALRYLEPATTPAREVRRRERPFIIHDTWVCRPQPPLPCRALLPLARPRPPRSLEVSFHDGDNPPLSELSADLWRRRDVSSSSGRRPRSRSAWWPGPHTLTSPLLRPPGPGRVLLATPGTPPSWARVALRRGATRGGAAGCGRSSSSSPPLPWGSCCGGSFPRPDSKGKKRPPHGTRAAEIQQSILSPHPRAPRPKEFQDPRCALARVSSTFLLYCLRCKLYLFFSSMQAEL